MRAITKGALHLAMQITGCEDEAKDILQTAVIKSMQHKNAPKPEEHGFKAWFYKVVHNQAIDWLRKDKRLDREQDFNQTTSNTMSPDQIFEQEQRQAVLHQALACLSAEHREIICLKDFHDFSYQEIAEVLSVEKGTVMSRLHRARVALKQQLTDMGMN